MLGNYRTLTFIVLAIVLGFFAIRPQWVHIGVLQVSIAENTEVLNNLGLYNERIASILRERDSFTPAEMARLDAFIAADGINTAQAVYNLEQAVLLQGMSLVAIHPFEIERGTGTVNVSTVASADFTTQDIELTVLGTYPSFKKFMQSIENTLEPYEITYIKFDNESNSDILSYTIRVRISALTL